MNESNKFDLNMTDLKNVGKNALTFVGPDLIIFFGALQLKFQAEQAFIGALLLNLLIDMLKKYLAGKN